MVIRRLDEEAGEIPMAFVVKKPKANISQYDVINFVAKQVCVYNDLKVKKHNTSELLYVPFA